MKIINEIIDRVVAELQLPICAYSVTHPKVESHGDYSVNVAMILAKQLSQNPRKLAAKIVGQIYKDRNFAKVFEKIEVAGAGFINFYLTKEYLLKELTNATDPKYGKNDKLNGQKTFVEFTDPNPFKEFHIGHLMSNTIGEALCRIFEANGAIVKRANYQGDVGLHVAKSIWGLEQKLKIDEKKLSDLQALTLKERIGYLGAAYAYGAGLYETDETAKTQMNEMNGQIYKRTNAQINEYYDQGRAWSLEYFETIYSRLGTKFDEYFFESEAGPVGLKVIEEALKKEVLELGEEGAVVFKGEKYGLHTRVFRNKLGLPTYEGKELGLPQMKYGRWAYDKSFIVTANEIDEYFKVLLKVLSLISPELGAKTAHLSHGMMKLTSGKMSSRTGKVVTGEGLLDELKETVLAKMADPSSPRQGRKIENKEIIADQVAVGALKYTVLRQALGGDIVYEPEKMTNLEGNTGPFIQYTYARASSILRKVKSVNQQNGESVNQFVGMPGEQEMSVLRWLYRYPEVVSEAGENYAPHLVATYIYELASRFNSFYQACRVEENGEVNNLRYELTRATANVLKNGLGLLGIQAPEEM